jgi:hypothetical protein
MQGRRIQRGRQSKTVEQAGGAAADRLARDRSKRRSKNANKLRTNNAGNRQTADGKREAAGRVDMKKRR